MQQQPIQVEDHDRHCRTQRDSQDDVRSDQDDERVRVPVFEEEEFAERGTRRGDC